MVGALDGIAQAAETWISHTDVDIRFLERVQASGLSFGETEFSFAKLLFLRGGALDKRIASATDVQSTVDRLVAARSRLTEFKQFNEDVRKGYFRESSLEYFVIQDWHDIAHMLVNAFEWAMRPTNPLPMGRSKGAIPRFIVAVVPHITGGKLNVDQVGKYLRDRPPPAPPPWDGDNSTD
jgi:hypothetical protein